MKRPARRKQLRRDKAEAIPKLVAAIYPLFNHARLVAVNFVEVNVAHGLALQAVLVRAHQRNEHVRENDFHVCQRLPAGREFRGNGWDLF